VQHQRSWHPPYTASYCERLHDAALPAADILPLLQSIVNYEVELPKEDIKQLHVPLEDDEDSNLLQQLPTCIEFIATALEQGGNVLVHCNAGASRSAAVTIAYIMSSRKLGTEQVLEVIQKKNPRAKPNDGFVDQLRLFEQMGYKLDPSNAEYRRFYVQQVKLPGWQEYC
jgi:dual specificity phosphatase 12